jgi:hypothetical protein
MGAFLSSEGRDVGPFKKVEAAQPTRHKGSRCRAVVNDAPHPAKDSDCVTVREYVFNSF